MGNINDCNFPGCMTIISRCDKTNEVDNNDFTLPYPFSKLDIERDLSSHGKRWLFHFNEKCQLKRCLFPPGYKLYGNENEFSHCDLFLIENRNIIKFYHDVLAAIIHFHPIVGINKCKLVMFRNIYVKKSNKISASYFEIKKKLAK